jgi:ABC-type transport system involved in cytochrome c biogenesis permease subunit
MGSIAALSIGTKLMLASGVLLFSDMFLTWQTFDVPFGKRFTVTKSLDAWDAWGLILGLLTVSLLLILIVREVDAELSPDVPWNAITTVLGLLVLAVALVKNLTDEHSAVPSYVGAALAALVAVGAVLDRSRPEPEPRADAPPLANWKPRVRPGAPPPAEHSSSGRAQTEPETWTAESSQRW